MDEKHLWFSNRSNMISFKRHLLKTVTWRIIGTFDTILIAGIISGDWSIGFSIGGLELITKTILYFLHERVWYKFSKYGVKK